MSECVCVRFVPFWLPPGPAVSAPSPGPVRSAAPEVDCWPGLPPKQTEDNHGPRTTWTTTTVGKQQAELLSGRDKKHTIQPIQK